MSQFHLVDLLTPEECLVTIKTLDRLSSHWTPRISGIPFFTMGTPSYIDGKSPRATYVSRVNEMNPLLSAHFAVLLSKVRSSLQDHLQEELIDLPGASLPGFHIFGSHPSFTRPQASIHFDLQHMMVDWPSAPARESVVSFTLPVALPTHGGGLNWWDIDYENWFGLEEGKRQFLAETSEKHFLSYQTGRLVVHSGLLLHQIAPARVILPEDRRITLQGHAAKAGERYYWYW